MSRFEVPFCMRDQYSQRVLSTLREGVLMIAIATIIILGVSSNVTAFQDGVERTVGESVVVFSLNGIPLEDLFEGLPFAPDLPSDSAKATGCWAGFFADESDYGCNGWEPCPWVALCRFTYYYLGCQPNYFNMPECNTCASDLDCFPGW